MQRFEHKGVVIGCDEAGRGCLAGPVVAAAVILPQDFYHPDLNDSKKLSESKRYALRKVIEEQASSWAIGQMSPQEIDEHNILRASFLSMHRALDQIKGRKDLILVDGNRFIPYKEVKHECVIKGDSKYYSIAAASILAKTYRDDIMRALHQVHEHYGWHQNKGYPTKAHRSAIAQFGVTTEHRKSFKLLPDPTLWS